MLLNRNNEFIKAYYLQKVAPQSFAGRALNDLYWSMKQIAASLYQKLDLLRITSGKLPPELDEEGYNDPADVLVNEAVGSFLATRSLSKLLEKVSKQLDGQMLDPDDDSE